MRRVPSTNGGGAVHEELGEVPPSAKLASKAPSSFRIVTRAFWTCRSPAELRSSEVSTWP